MAIAAGSKSGLSVIEESTINVLPTSTTYTQVPLRNETLSEAIEKVVAEDIRPDRQSPEVRGGNKAISGDITHDLGCVRSALFLKHMLCASYSAPTALTVSNLASSTAYVVGDVVAGTNNDYVCIKGGTTGAGEDNTDLAGAAGASGIIHLSTTSWMKVGASGVDSGTDVYKHELAAGINFPAVGLSFEKSILGGNSAKYVQLSGCRVNSLNLSIEQNKALSATWNILGVIPANSGTSVASGVTAVNDRAVSGHEVFVGINTKTGAYRPVRGGSIRIDNQSDPNVYICGSRNRRDIVPGTRALTGTIETYFEDSTEYDYFANETEITLDFVFYTGGNILWLYFPKVKFTGDATPKIAGSGAMTAPFSFDAYTNGTNDCIAYLINNDSDLYS